MTTYLHRDGEGFVLENKGEVVVAQLWMCIRRNVSSSEQQADGAGEWRVDPPLLPKISFFIPSSIVCECPP